MRCAWILLTFTAALQAQDSIDWADLAALKEEGKLEEALEVVRAIQAPSSVRLAREEFGLLFQLRRYKEAQEVGAVWIRLAEEAGDPDELLDALAETARSFAPQDKKEEESQLLLRAAELAKTLGRTDRAPAFLMRRATLEAAMGRYASAADLLDRAEAIQRHERDGVLEARLQAARAGLMFSQHRWREALAFCEKTLQLAEREGLKELERSTLVNLAQVHIRLHQYVEALGILHRSLELAANVRNRSIALASIGICHYELNQFDRAAEAFEEVLQLSRESGNRNFEAWALGELGLTVWKDERNAEAALSYLDQSVDLYLKTGDLVNALVFMENKAMVYRDLGRWQEALLLYREAEARTRRDLPGKEPPPHVYKSIGQCLAGLGRFAEAERTLREAIRRAEAAGDAKQVWQGNHELARVFAGTGRIGEADLAYRKALDTIESFREALQLEAFKTDFFTDKVQVYEEYVDFLMERRGEEGARLSFEVAERAAARSLLDALAESRASLHETLPGEVLESEKSLMDAISRLQGRIREGEASAEMQSELHTLQEKLEQLHLRVRREHRAFAELRYPQPAGLAAVQRSLKTDELLLKYHVGETSSHLWLVDPKGIRSKRLPGRNELEPAVQRVLADLVTPGAHSPALNELAEVLLPEAELNASSARFLIIVPSGILFYFPFEILPAGPDGAPLVESHQTSYLPSAAFLAESRNEAPRSNRPRLLALGDPQYEGAAGVERIGTLVSAGKLGSIPHTRAEVAAVYSHFGRLSSTSLVGPHATEAALKAQSLELYSVLHLAVHGVIDSSMPSRSGLILGRGPDSEEDGILQVNEILRLPLNANLVTLSACQTALGRLVTGEGMVGLSRAFLYAGADTIVASLWNVNDEASAEFMTAFYGLLREGHGKAEALRRAKVSLKREARYGHPYYWAPYVLIGEGSDAVAFPAGWTSVLLFVGAAVLFGVPLMWILRRRSPSLGNSQLSSRQFE